MSNSIKNPWRGADFRIRHRRSQPFGRHHRRAHGAQVDEKQKVLEIQNLRERLEHLLGLVEGEIDILQVEKRIRGRVKQQMEKASASII